MFGGSPAGLPANQLLDIFKDVPSYELPKNELIGSAYLDLLVSSKAANSKGAARRLIQEGGAYLNNERVSDLEQAISNKDLIDDQVLILRTGKKKYFLVRTSG